MNKLLERAFAEVAKLSEDQQEAIARRILEDVEAERGWDERFATLQDRLAELGRQAGKHIADGTISPYDPSDRPGK